MKIKINNIKPIATKKVVQHQAVVKLVAPFMTPNNGAPIAKPTAYARLM